MTLLLRLLFTAMLLGMIALVIDTSLKSNLFEVWSDLAQIPWMVTTLVDFYFLITVIYLWVWSREPQPAARALWLVLFVTLGSIAVSAYVLLQLRRVDPSRPLQSLFGATEPRPKSC